MTLDEIRVQIDAVDTQMKPLFLKRMECAGCVAETKRETGGDVFVLERELAIIEKRAGDVAPEVREEYVMFLRHLMSVSRRYQYGILTEMQDRVLEEALEAAGLSAEKEHSQIEIAFACDAEASDFNLFVNMAKLNQIPIISLNLETEEGRQKIRMILKGNLKDQKMRQLLCQIGKEAEGFQIVGM